VKHHPVGGTSFYAGMSKVGKLLEKFRHYRFQNVIIFLTDGENEPADQQKTLSLIRQIRNTERALGVREPVLVTVSFGAEANRASLQAMVELMGEYGLFVPVLQADELIKTFVGVSDALKKDLGSISTHLAGGQRPRRHETTPHATPQPTQRHTHLNFKPRDHARRNKPPTEKSEKEKKKAAEHERKQRLKREREQKQQAAARNNNKGKEKEGEREKGGSS